MRTKLYPLGLPNLSDADFVKVSVGNCLLHASLKVVRQCRKNKVAVTFENPLRSQMWWVPSMQRLARSAQTTDLDFCCFHTRWRKPTKVLSWGVDLQELGKKCQPVNGLCSTSHRPHLVLEGAAPGGMKWTKVAEPYPQLFCASYALLVSEQPLASHLLSRGVDKAPDNES